MRLCTDYRYERANDNTIESFPKGKGGAAALKAETQRGAMAGIKVRNPTRKNLSRGSVRPAPSLRTFMNPHTQLKAAGWVNPLCFVAFFFFMAFAFWPLVFYAIDKQVEIERGE